MKEAQPTRTDELPHNHPRRADEMCQCPDCKAKDAITYGASTASEPLVIPFYTGKLMIVCRKTHPHYGCTGYLSGELISLFGAKRAKIVASACSHGVAAFYVRPGDIREVNR